MTLASDIRALAEKATKGPYTVKFGDKERGTVYGPGWHPIAKSYATRGQAGYDMEAAAGQKDANLYLIALLLNHATQIADALDFQRGPLNGVNCSGCGCRLPADYTAVCPDCGELGCFMKALPTPPTKEHPNDPG